MIPNLSGINEFFTLLSNGAFMSEVFRRGLVMGIGSLIVLVGVLLFVSGTRTAATVAGVAADGAVTAGKAGLAAL